LWNTPGKLVQGLPKVSGYFAEWSIYDRNYFIADLVPYAKDLNTLIYSFSNIY
jgi:GH18 family chitinase